MGKKIRVLYKKPGMAAKEIEIENTLKAFQLLVGGYIEVVTISRTTIAVVNEEGRILGLPENILGLAGPIVFCSTKGEEFASLSYEAISMLNRLVLFCEKG